MPLFIAYNGPEPTTAARVALATGTAIKTHLQVATPATRRIFPIEWGYSIKKSATAQDISISLIETDVAATVTSLTPTRYRGAAGETSVCVGGAALTGYNATAEGSIAAVRTFDSHIVQPGVGPIARQYPLGREGAVDVSKFLRIRILSSVTVDVVCWVAWEE